MVVRWSLMYGSVNGSVAIDIKRLRFSEMKKTIERIRQKIEKHSMIINGTLIVNLSKRNYENSDNINGWLISSRSVCTDDKTCG